MKKKNRKVYVSVVSVILTVIMLLSVSCGIIAESADKLLENAVSRTVKSISEWEIFDIVNDVFTEGSLDADVKLAFYHSYLGVSLKYVGDLAGKTRRATAAFALDSGGKEKYDLSLFVSDKDVILADGKSAYGFSLDGIREKLANSAFSPKKDNLLGISDEDFEKITEIFEKINETMKENKNGETAKTVEELKEKYSDLFFKTFRKEVELSMKKVNDAAVLDKTGVKAKVLSCTIDNEDIAAIIDTLWNKAKDDEKLKTFLGDALESTKLVTGTHSVDEIFTDVEKWTEDAKKELNEGKNSISAALYLNAKTGTIMKAEFSGKSGKDEASMTDAFALSIELGVEFKTFEGFKLSTHEYDDDGDLTDSYELSVTVSDTDAEYKITVNSTDPIVQENFGGEKDYEAEPLILAWNKQTGDLTLTSGNKEILNGKFTKADGAYTLTCKLGDESDAPELTVVAKTKDTVPDEPAEYCDVLSLTGDELTKEIENVFTDSPLLAFIMNVITEIGFRTQAQPVYDY